MTKLAPLFCLLSLVLAEPPLISKFRGTERRPHNGYKSNNGLSLSTFFHNTDGKPHGKVKSNNALAEYIDALQSYIHGVDVSGSGKALDIINQPRRWSPFKTTSLPDFVDAYVDDIKEFKLIDDGASDYKVYYNTATEKYEKNYPKASTPRSYNAYKNSKEIGAEILSSLNKNRFNHKASKMHSASHNYQDNYDNIYVPMRKWNVENRLKDSNVATKSEHDNSYGVRKATWKLRNNTVFRIPKPEESIDYTFDSVKTLSGITNDRRMSDYNEVLKIRGQNTDGFSNLRGYSDNNDGIPDAGDISDSYQSPSKTRHFPSEGAPYGKKSLKTKGFALRSSPVRSLTPKYESNHNILSQEEDVAETDDLQILIYDETNQSFKPMQLKFRE